MAFSSAKWVASEAKQQGIDMNTKCIQALVTRVGVDQWQLSGELDKLVLSGQPVTKEKIQQLVESSPQATSFELLDATFRGQDERAENLFAVVSRQEDPYMFFGLLSSQIYAAALMAHARGMSPESVAKAAGMHPFVLKKIQPLAQSLTRQQLRELTLRLAELDSNIKSRSVAPWTQILSFLRSLRLEN
jgi:DNA polymerase-3 subunit delta